MARREKFPVFWTVILLFGVAWFLSELGYLDINIPWLPLILIVISMGFIFNRFNK